MSSTLLIKRSSVAAKIPTTGQMSIGEMAINTNDGRVFGKGNNGADFIFEIGASKFFILNNWNGVAAAAAVGSYEFDQFVYAFTQGSAQSITAYLKVPESYIAGKQISLKAYFYSPSLLGSFRFQSTATLVRKNNDQVNSTTNQLNVNTSDITNSTTNQLRDSTLAVTSTTGTINAVAVSAGDLIKITLTRVAPTLTEDTGDVRFIPDLTEVQL